MTCPDCGGVERKCPATGTVIPAGKVLLFMGLSDCRCVSGSTKKPLSKFEKLSQLTAVYGHTGPIAAPPPSTSGQPIDCKNMPEFLNRLCHCPTGCKGCGWNWKTNIAICPQCSPLSASPARWGHAGEQARLTGIPMSAYPTHGRPLDIRYWLDGWKRVRV